jgi:cyclic-di-GMP-binding protein
VSRHGWANGVAIVAAMPSFDVVSEVDMQEVRNAVDQADRELSQRFDFKGTNSSIELKDKEKEIEMKSVSEDRINAVRQVLEEKLVKRKLSLKAIEHGKVEDAAGGTARQVSKLQAGISSDKARAINKFIKEHGPKGMQSQTQGEQVRVTAKKRDDLQQMIAALKEEDFGIPLQFENFRD